MTTTQRIEPTDEQIEKWIALTLADDASLRVAYSRENFDNDRFAEQAVHECTEFLNSWYCEACDAITDLVDGVCPVDARPCRHPIL